MFKISFHDKILKGEFMNKIFLDINEFKNTYPLMQALKTYSSINGRSHFLIKADGNEYQILDDLKFIKRRIKFDEDDLNECNFNLKTFESFDTFKRNKSNTYFRILDDSKNNKKTLYLFYSKDITFNELNEKLQLVINFYKEYINAKEEIKIGIINKFENDLNLLKELKSLDNFHEVIELNKLLDNTSNIVLLDDEVTYYTFNLLSTYSKFMKLAKSVSGYASFFKPFSYQKMAPKEVNLNSYFSFSLFEITSKDKLINIYVQENISPTELIDFLSIIDTFIN